MQPATTYLFSGGGTGGHLFPGIAVSQELRRREPDARIVFVGSSRAIESTIVTQNRLEHRMLPVESLAVLKRNPVGFIWKNWQACRAARSLIDELQPNAVIGLGGFASAPVVWTARRRRVPVILLEQNVIPGRTTRWLCRYADQVCVSFGETVSKLRRASRAIVTGNPVRDEIADLHGDGSNSAESATSPTTKTLLILGGSQGADSLNDAVIAALRQIRDLISDWQIIHQTGPRQTDDVRSAYQQIGLNAIVEPFFSDLASQYGRASLVISRAGATTLAELACVGVASILLPYPHAADDHQRENARVFRDHQAGVIVEHGASTGQTATKLTETLRELVTDSDRRKAMSGRAKGLGHPDAAKKIVDEIQKLARMA